MENETKLENRDAWDICRDFISARNAMDRAQEEFCECKKTLETANDEIIKILSIHGAIKHCDTIITLENGIPKILECVSSCGLRIAAK